jgi:nitrogen fixation protein
LTFGNGILGGTYIRMYLPKKDYEYIIKMEKQNNGVLVLGRGERHFDKR